MAYNFVQANGSRIIIASSPISTPPATFSAWIRGDATATGTRNVALCTSGNDFLIMRISSAGSLQARVIFDNGNTTLSANSANTLSIGAWTHVAARFSLSGSTMQPFASINGITTSGGTFTGFVQSALQFSQIGSEGGSGSFGGDIADVGIWNTALSDAEIVSLSKGIACNRVRPQSLRFYAPLIRSLIDIRNNRTLTTFGSPTVSNHPRIYT